MDTINLVIIVFFFAVILGFAFAKPKYIPGRALFLIRALLPSWRFFEEVTEVPKLYFRLKANDYCEPWASVLFTPKRKSDSLILNPESNLLFAYGGVLQHVIQDLEDAEDGETFMHSVSYRLTESLVRFEVLRQALAEEGSDFQFKISTLMQGADESSVEDVLISASHKL